MKINNHPRGFSSRGRLLTVGGRKWRWRCGRGGNVIAYSEDGERRCAGAWVILGIDPDTFGRGQWKRTRDGMVRPSDVAKWLSVDMEVVPGMRFMNGGALLEAVRPNPKVVGDWMCRMVLEDTGLWSYSRKAVIDGLVRG